MLSRSRCHEIAPKVFVFVVVFVSVFVVLSCKEKIVW